MAQRLCPVLVGREEEADALRRSLDHLRAGRGGCVLLVGEAGIGKSRLIRELSGWASEEGVPVLTGRSVPASGSTAYRPLAEALLQILRQRPLPSDPDLDQWLPLLSPLVPNLIAADGQQAEVPPGLRAEALLQLLRRLVPSGVVLVVEDLHWADPDTLAAVEYLAGNLHTEPLLLVATLRDGPGTGALEVAGRLRGRAGVVRLDLERLDDEELEAMIRACWPEADTGLVHRVTEASEGVPLLVEDLLASPGLPADFAATVQTRLEALEEGPRLVIEAAAVLGRHFDFRLLPAITGLAGDEVSAALAVGVEALLLTSQDGAMRFRHALTREAVLATLIPPRQRQLAHSALAAVLASGPVMEMEQREVAVDLALRAEDRPQAGRLLAESGRLALRWGALSTAAETLERASDLHGDTPERTATDLDLIEALSLAGRVDEAAAVGGRLVARLGGEPTAREARIDTHLRLTQAAVAAARWPMARHHLDQARRLLGADGPGGAQAARLAVLEAELAVADGDYARAGQLADEVLGAEVTAELRCHAFEIIGRIRRSTDLAAGREAFEQALVTAEGADLALWRLRALHELGTIDMFDHAGVDRLLEARRAAERMGALSTAAILDLQLAAAVTCRWDLDACDAHAHSALNLAQSLGLDQVRAKALAMLTGSAGMRADLAATDRYAGLAVAAAPEDKMLEGFGWGMRAMARLLAGDEEGSVEPYGRGMAILGRLPHAEPAALRALWPLFLASRADRRAAPAVDEARHLGVSAFHLNRSMIGYAEAVLAGRRGDTRRANELAALADTGWVNCEGWADLSRLLAAPAALAGGWGDPASWLAGAPERFTARGLPEMSRRCRDLLGGLTANPWAAAGVTAREADVLRLLAEGLANKEVAARLNLSPRTVEKHVESLLRKAGARSRTELISRMDRLGAPAT